MITYRELTQDEFEQIPAEALGGFQLVPGQRVAAALEGAEIVGIWVTTWALHAEPVWIREDHRKHPAIIRRMWDGVKKIVRDMDLGGVVGIIPDAVPVDRRIAEWLGAEKIPGNIYLWLDKKEN